eukprot:13984101-Alexandrium_andersonii.AAC.1
MATASWAQLPSGPPLGRCPPSPGEIAVDRRLSCARLRLARFRFRAVWQLARAVQKAGERSSVRARVCVRVCAR